MRDKRGERELDRAEPGCALDGRFEVADLAGIARKVGRAIDDDALERALAERYVHDLARRDGATGRNAVREGHGRRPPGVYGDAHKAGSGVRCGSDGHASMIRSLRRGTEGGWLR